MYLRNIVIKNIGPIKELSVELPFRKNGDPKPIIFVGENGSGKTILQSQIIDGLYEIGGELFNDIQIREGFGHKYYKISGGSNLRFGEKKGFSLLSFIDNKAQKIEYYDKIGDVEKTDFTNFISDFSLSIDGKNIGNSQNKKVTSMGDERKEELKKEWEQGVHFYQPAYRYEEPFWKNNSYIDYTRFEDKKIFSGELSKELEIISSTKENKSFLLDLVLDRFVQNSNSYNIVLWDNINVILRKILRKDNYRLGIGPRGGYRVSVVEDVNQNDFNQILPSIDNLSLGESILLNVFVNIIRHSGNYSKPLNQIQGVVVIDEIDVHLHTNLQSSVLPELIKMFPKIQFIITSHSPLFLLGMKKTFGEEGIEVRNMPKGEMITTERFSEFKNAYDVLRETERFEGELKKKIIEVNKPIVYVEGPTDVQYIKKAYELYNKNCTDFDIEIIGEKTKVGTKNSNNKALFSAQKLLSANINLLKQKVILLNDPEEQVADGEYGELLYIRKMPKFNENLLQRGIENLFKKTFLDNVIKENKECFSYLVKGGKKENHRIIDGQKQTICKWICDNGQKKDFKNFEKIFEIIDSIIKQD